jgi:myo-inositol-1-phosphate synthase
MLERERLESKKISKTNAVTSQLEYDMGAKNVHIGPSDHVEWLEDRKWAYIRLEGRSFGDAAQHRAQARGGRLAQLRRHRDRRRALRQDRPRPRSLRVARGPSSYFMKSPPVQHADDTCRCLTEEFIAGEGRGATAVLQG